MDFVNGYQSIMILGNGLIASAFNPYFSDDESVVVFASGVSNSRETRTEAFLRERQMLLDAMQRERFLLYFSTCSVNDPELADAPYVIHKKEMEKLVRSTKEHAIFRLPQIVGKTPNPNTLTNYFHRQIVSGTHFQVWRHAKRNLIDIDDVTSIITHFMRNSLGNRVTENIATPLSISIPRLVEIFELVTKKKANCSIIDAGGSYSIDSVRTVALADQVGITFDDSYVEAIIRKYYG